MGQQKHLFENVQRFTSLIHSFKALSICGLALGYAACTSDNGIDSNANDSVLTIESGLTNVTPEFTYNYNLLRYFYIDQKTYLGLPEDYIGKANAQAMSEKNIPWDFFNLYYMYDQMNDPFTYYLDPSRSISWLNQLTNSEQTIGAGFDLDSSYIPMDKYIVKDVAKKSPADKAGLRNGDEIIAIEGVPITNSVLFTRLAKAAEGDIIHYTVKRDSATLEIHAVIAQYNLPTVYLSYKDSIPVIEIDGFTSETPSDSGTFGEFITALRETKQYKSTIIDLRNNGGGDIDQCTAMIKVFLAKGDTAIGMMYTQADTVNKRQVIDTTYQISTEDGIAKDRYFVFLANGKTASCSETLIAGAVSNKKFPIVGTTTYGKGIGQSIKLTPSISIASITAFKFFDKDGLSYHKYGIDPDFAISDNDLALAKATELAKEMNFTRVAGYGAVNTGHFTKQSAELDTIPGSYLLPEEYRKKF